MTQEEFINAALHKPWVNRASSFDEMDCYGLVQLYFEHVDGNKLPTVQGYKEGHEFGVLWRREIEKTWRQIGKFTDGAMVTFYDPSDSPVHVGMCVNDGKVIHCRGSEGKAGRVEIHNFSTLEKAYKFATFHKVIING